ncbi:MAG: flexitail domain-containing putative surface protein [Dehalococcoidia bacterium]
MSIPTRARVIFLLTLAAAPFLASPGPAVASGLSAIAAGDSHTCAIVQGGAVQCWGLNENGQLGNGAEGPSDPNPIPGLVVDGTGGVLRNVTAISAGLAHTCALVGGTGGVKCWGKNFHGQLGDGQACGDMNCPAPVEVSGLSSGVIAISSGTNHTCALTSAGGVRCWGLNNFGQLGTQTLEFCVILSFSFPCSTVPVDVNSLDSGVVAIAAGIEHTCAVLGTGGIRCWGANYRGQLGNGTTIDSTDPVDVCQVYDDVGQSCTQLLSGAAGAIAARGHTCAVVEPTSDPAETGVRCWGRNEAGQIGGQGGTCCFAGAYRATPQDMEGLPAGVTVLGLGNGHSCVVLPQNGAIQCWGLNDGGQLGDGTTDTPWPTPRDVVGLDGPATAVVGGGTHSCALMADASIECWGLNQSGQLGDGTTELRTAATEVLIDVDMDQCLAQRERGPDALQGGERDPKNGWDFFDTPDALNVHDRVVTAGDLARVVARFGATGDPDIDPLSEPALAPAYHTAFDRTLVGPNLWNAGPPNGSITAQDLGLIVAQFGHSCA